LDGGSLICLPISWRISLREELEVSGGARGHTRHHCPKELTAG
jgi:hypothetical protein